MTFDEIQREAATMQEYLETPIPDDVNAIIERARHIAAYHARTGHMLATAKQLVRAKKASEIGETIVKLAKENYLAAKAQNALVECIASEEMFLVDWLDRLNSMCVHQIDLIRSIISKEKTEMQIASYSNYGNMG
jgi:type III secretion system FlhB-like substrate exporter